MMNKENGLTGVFNGAEPNAKRASFNSIRAEALDDASQKIDRFDSFTTEDKQEYKKILADADSSYGDSEKISDEQVHAQILLSELEKAGIDIQNWSQNS